MMYNSINDDIGRGITAVRLGVGQVLTDAEATMFVLQAAYSAGTTEERVSADGTLIGMARERVAALVGVLNAALLLCRDLTPTSASDDFTAV